MRVHTWRRTLALGLATAAWHLVPSPAIVAQNTAIVDGYRVVNTYPHDPDAYNANVWHTDRIARISPASGRVLGWIDLSGLLPAPYRRDPEAVLNGIAFDEGRDRLFVTGKLWPRLFEIDVVPRR